MALTFAADFADSTGTSLCDLRAPMKLTFMRNRARQADVSLDIQGSEAVLLTAALADGLPRMRVWMRDGDQDGQLVLNAPWAPMREDAEDGETTGGTLQALFRDPFALLERRPTPVSLTYTAEDAGQIAWSLINGTSGTLGPTGINEGTIQATVDRDRTYENTTIAEVIVQLTEVQGGFDFEIAPVDDGVTIGEFNVYASQGQDRTIGDQAVVFEFGPDTISNVRKCGRETQSPINWVRALGEGGIIAEASDATSIAKYGAFADIIQALDVSEQSTLEAKAQGALRPDPIRVTNFEPDPELAPQPWRDYWLGDLVIFRADLGSLNLDIRARVNGIELDIDEDGNVSTVTLTIDQAT